MSNKISSTAKFVTVLTLLGCIIPTIYLNTFSEGYLLYHGLNHSGTATISGLLCLIGIIGGVAGIFGKKVTGIDRIICLVCTSFCVAFLLYAVLQSGAPREKNNRIYCSSRLKDIYMALRLYAEDYAGYYPPQNGIAGMEMLRRNYLTVFICPSIKTVRGKNKEPLTEETLDYVYIGGLNTKSDPNLPIVYDKAKNHGKYFGNVLFVDGTIKGIYGDPWTQNIKK